MYTVVYEPTAEKDLFEILQYYEKQGGQILAKIIYDKIINATDKLAVFPESKPTSEDYYPDTRVLVIQKLPYKAFFRINENNKTVHVISIIHTSRQFPAQ